METEEHKAYHRKLYFILGIILLIFLGGSTFYYYTEKWRFLDSMYFAAATMTTVGYGDFSPHTDAGKLFTIFYLFTSVGIVIYGLSLFTGHFVETREEHWFESMTGAKHQTKKFKDILIRIFKKDKT